MSQKIAFCDRLSIELWHQKRILVNMKPNTLYIKWIDDPSDRISGGFYRTETYLFDGAHKFKLIEKDAIMNNEMKKWNEVKWLVNENLVYIEGEEEDFCICDTQALGKNVLPYNSGLKAAQMIADEHNKVNATIAARDARIEELQTKLDCVYKIYDAGLADGKRQRQPEIDNTIEALEAAFCELDKDTAQIMPRSNTLRLIADVLGSGGVKSVKEKSHRMLVTK